MAQLKTSEYPAKTVFNDGDLYDVSTFDGVSVYTTEKLTFAQLKTELNSALSFASDSIYTGSGTVPTTTVATITDTLTFDGGDIGLNGKFVQSNGAANTAQINGGTLSTNAVFSVRSISASASATIFEGRNSGDAITFLVNNNGCFASSNIQNTSAGIGI